MNGDRIFEALAIPPEARVNQRVPKKLLTEHGAPTATDKRHIQEGIEEIRWLAALKPSNVGIPEYRDQVREYLEIAILSAELRPTAKVPRLTELIHRAIPYPVLLITSQAENAVVSLVHKRFSQNEGGQFVMDGEVCSSPPVVNCQAEALEKSSKQFLKSLPLAAQPRVHLCALYDGWIECIEAFRAAQLTGRFFRASSPQAATVRRIALASYDHIQREISSLRARAEKEKQISRRVDLNLEIRRLEGELATAALNL